MSYIQDTCWGVVIPLCSGAVGVFYSPSQLGKRINEKIVRLLSVKNFYFQYNKKMINKKIKKKTYFLFWIKIKIFSFDLTTSKFWGRKTINYFQGSFFVWGPLFFVFFFCFFCCFFFFVVVFCFCFFWSGIFQGFFFALVYSCGGIAWVCF